MDDLAAAPPGASRSARLGIFSLLLGVLSVLFWKPLFALARLAASDNLYSHIPLIPLVSIYLVWLQRDRLSGCCDAVTARRRWPGVVAALCGALTLAAYWLAPPSWKAQPANAASALMFAYLCGVWSISVAVFGWPTVRRLLFPFAFLIFIVPFPVAVTHAIEVFFQHASADAASVMIGISQTPVLREGLFFKLPGITLQVAEECSGIRSTLVLFITSLAGGYMFFELRRYRAILALAVIPIAILRNGFRIFTIAWLCVHVDPEMIHSAIHRRGGPLFFALSLIPFFALLFWMYRRERKGVISGSVNSRAVQVSRGESEKV